MTREEVSAIADSFERLRACQENGFHFADDRTTQCSTCRWNRGVRRRRAPRRGAASRDGLDELRRMFPLG